MSKNQERRKNQSDEISKVMLEESINKSDAVLNYVLNTSDINGSIEMLSSSPSSLYESILNSLLKTVNAFLTLEKRDIEIALKSVNETAELSNSIRRKGFIKDMSKIIITPNYNKYTELEIHAQLTHAKFLAFSGVLSLIENPNFISLIKTALKFRACISCYKECRLIFKKREKWSSEKSKNNFESGIRLANGVINLVISHLPPKILRLVNFLGMKGIRKVAFKELNRAAFELEGLSSIMSRFVLLVYYCYAEPNNGFGDINFAAAKKILNENIKTYPNSFAFKLFQAKISQLTGQIDQAVDIYQECLNVKLHTAHKIMHWELMWCHGIKSEWDQCIKYASYLRKYCLHSPSVCTYVEAVFRYVKAEETGDKKLRDEALNLFRIVPTLRIRYVAKTITPEKIVVMNSLKFLQNEQYIILPVLEMFYHVGIMNICSTNQEVFIPHLRKIQEKLEIYKSDSVKDRFATALFYKGLIYRYMKNYNQALECFCQILNEEDQIEKEHFLKPQAAMEIGFTKIDMKQYDQAKAWLNKAKKDYSGYLTENLCLIRIHAALKMLGIETDENDNYQNSNFNSLLDQQDISVSNGNGNNHSFFKNLKSKSR